MKLILSGGGSGKDTEELDKKFSSLLDKSKPLLYIPIAINNKKHPYSECLKWLRSTFDSFGMSSYEMITEENINSLKNKNPKDFSGIYVGGGNTPYLLKIIKDTCLWNFLKSALRNGVPIYGGSAGAVIFGRTIIPAMPYDKNEVRLKDLNGFNILNETEIACHYSENEKQKIQDIIIKNKIKKLIALTERNGLFVANTSVTLIGKEKGFIFKEGKIKSISIGEKVKY
jgi:dipeptidase E